MAFQSPQTLMVQGTTSDAGKSILVTALCRILARNQISVAPFKPQNMALNSAVTAEGGEIGRAQAVQSEACFLAPSIAMNPILLKPNSDMGAQVIVNGKAIGNMNAEDYHRYKPELLPTVLQAHDSLKHQYQVVFVEGAGSPAEINLREHDIANMGFAEAVDCPVIIVADIDRGGVFAHLYGTFELLSDTEKARVKGFVINRFRGDVKLLEPGLEWLEKKTGVPTLGVIPYVQNLHIEAEDSISQSQKLQTTADRDVIKVVVPMYPRASNHTDFDVLRMHPQVDCQLLRESSGFQEADLIVLPGSKHVRGDLQWLFDNGWYKHLQQHLRYGGKVIGICGGYQMLGNWVHDPEAYESKAGSSQGLGFLNMETRLTGDKTLRNVTGNLLQHNIKIKGYEIHAGTTSGPATECPLFRLLAAEETGKPFLDGVRSQDNLIIGTYVHGLFDQPELLDYLLDWAGLDDRNQFDYPTFREAQIDRLADVVELEIPLSAILNLLSLSEIS